MRDKLKVAFDDPEHGWVGLTVSGRGETVTLTASYTPSDAFRDLTDALYRLFLYDGRARVVWHSGATEYEARFTREGDAVRLEVEEFPDHPRGEGKGARLFAASGTYEDICLPFWRALRSLQGRFTREELDARWHRPFPWEELDGLTALLRRER